MKSWDLFDTLIARWDRDPKEIFREVGRKMEFPNFETLRIQSEQRAAVSKGQMMNLSDIYAEFEKISHTAHEKAQKIMEIELETELSHSYAIGENASQIQDDDIIVSDMYLPISFIQELLETNGISGNRPIYVSHGGKHHGTIWKKIEDEVGKPELHIGDNAMSDFEKPKTFGIQTKLYSEHIGAGEGIIKRTQYYKSMSNLIRTLRLSNPYFPSNESAEYCLWKEQVDINIPVLILGSVYLANNFSNDKFLFSTREAEGIKKIFAALYPKRQAETFYTSRKTYIDCKPGYINYVTQCLVGNPIIVDLHGSGNTANKFFSRLGKFPPLIFVIGYKGMYPHTQYMVDIDIAPRWKGEIEDLNQDVLGSVSDVTESGEVIRAPLMYDKKIVQFQKDAVDKCTYFISSGFDTKPMPSCSKQQLKQTVKDILKLLEPHRCEIHNFGIPHLNDWPYQYGTFKLLPNANKILYAKKGVHTTK